MFVIEDEWHAELIGRYETLDAAMQALRRLAALPWDDDPNRAPCQSWRTCGRSHDLVEYDDSASPWREIDRRPMLEVRQASTTWSAPVLPSADSP